jgi:hypothetical protein
MKEKLTAEQIKKVQDHMKTILSMSGSDREQFIAMTIGDVYDEELGIPEVIDSIARFARAGNRPEDNHVYYLTPDSIDKKVFILDSNCNVTQAKVTPNTRTELTFAEVTTNDYWVCLKDFLAGDHDALQFYADSISEAMDRYEVKKVLELLDAAATAESKVFALDSGKETFDFPKLVEMARSIAKYGRNLVLISGGNITTDIMLMDYNANTFRAYGLESLNVKHIPVEDLTVDVDASGQASVIDPDVAYLVAVSDSKNNKPLLFARRQLGIALDMADTQSAPKDRIVIDTGNMKNVGGVNKYARGKAGYGQIGAVMINSKVVAKFSK